MFERVRQRPVARHSDRGRLQGRRRECLASIARSEAETLMPAEVAGTYLASLDWLCAQLGNERFGIFQVDGVEALSKPAIDSRE